MEGAGVELKSWVESGSAHGYLNAVGVAAVSRTPDDFAQRLRTNDPTPNTGCGKARQGGQHQAPGQLLRDRPAAVHNLSRTVHIAGQLWDEEEDRLGQLTGRSHPVKVNALNRALTETEGAAEVRALPVTGNDGSAHSHLESFVEMKHAFDQMLRLRFVATQPSRRTNIVVRLKLLAGLPAVTAVLVLASSAPASAATPTATASPSTGLVNGQTVTLTGSNYEPNHAIFVLECHSGAGASACDVNHLKTVTTSPTGTFSLTFTVITGAIGDGTCNPGQSCILAAGDASGVGSAATISFKAPATTPPPATTPKTTKPAKTATKPTTTKTSTGAGSAVPTKVSAGSGGGAGRDGMPVYSLLLTVLGGAAVVGAGLQFRSR